MSRTASVAESLGPSSNVIATWLPSRGPWEMVGPNHVSCGSLAPVQATSTSAATRAATGTIQPPLARARTVAVANVVSVAMTTAATATPSAQAVPAARRVTTTATSPTAAPPTTAPGGRHGRGAAKPAANPASTAITTTMKPGAD